MTILLTWLWRILLGAGLALEALAIVNSATRDTFSYQVWRFRRSMLGWILTHGLGFWLLWHFVIDDERGHRRWWDDVVVTVFGCTIGWWRRR